ncbi:MAG: HlyD family efflux transporter periplasmic adaptor subunit [Planctomycetaceae bacterium]|nr:HlyD family efflux transporter periplasmic adaptor subunit [Planctomycetaceae bacterium]
MRAILLLIVLFQVSGPGTAPKVSTAQLHGRMNELLSGQNAVSGSADPGEDVQKLLVDSSMSQLDPVNNVIKISMAKVDPEKTILISAGIQGKLTRLRVNAKDPVTGEDILDAEGKPVMIEVKEGQNVSRDQEIGTIDDSVELNQVAAAEAMLEVAIAEEKKKIEIEYARATFVVAAAAVERNDYMNQQTPNTIPRQQVLEDMLKKTQAKKQWEKAEYDLYTIRPAETNVKRMELAIAETRLKQRRLISPINGIIDEIRGHEGMWFREGDPILKITQYDTLWVKAKVNINHATPRMINGKTVEVIAEPLGKEPPLKFTGKVIFASQTIEGDDCFKIHVEVKNKLQDGYWLLNPGRFVELRIPL